MPGPCWALPEPGAPPGMPGAGGMPGAVPGGVPGACGMPGANVDGPATTVGPTALDAACP